MMIAAQSAIFVLGLALGLYLTTRTFNEVEANRDTAGSLYFLAAVVSGGIGILCGLLAVASIMAA